MNRLKIKQFSFLNTTFCNLFILTIIFILTSCTSLKLTKNNVAGIWETASGKSHKSILMFYADSQYVTFFYDVKKQNKHIKPQMGTYAFFKKKNENEKYIKLFPSYFAKDTKAGKKIKWRSPRKESEPLDMEILHLDKNSMEVIIDGGEVKKLFRKAKNWRLSNSRKIIQKE